MPSRSALSSSRFGAAPAIGLVVGGMAGTFVAADVLRQTLWTIDGVGIVIAAGDDLVAAGFLTFHAGASEL